LRIIGSEAPLLIETNVGEVKVTRFQVYKRDRFGRVTRESIVMADNKIQADTKAKMLYGKTLQFSNGEAVWTQELAA
jgi:hypothetical protein